MSFLFGTIVAACIILWLGSVCLCVVFSTQNPIWLAPALVILILGFGFVISQSSSEGPCLSYETRLIYNAETKTMMPARFCTNRGEWGK